MIASGEKEEEYREITDYWGKRLIGKNYETVTFHHGYSKDRRNMEFKLELITIRTGKEKWGAIGNRHYYVIKLGNRIE